MATKPGKSSRPARALGRSLSDFPNLTTAEKELLAACREGRTADFGGQRPEKPTDANTIRPGFIRFLLLGGDDENPVHENGVQVRGAWIGADDRNDLDLEYCVTRHPLRLLDCKLQGTIILRRASLAFVDLRGSAFRGIAGDGLNCTSDLHLRKVNCEGEARLLDAEIGGVLDCDGGQFINSDGKALNCDRAKIAGSVFLSGGFKADGITRLLNAEIGGSLNCRGSQFNGKAGNALQCDSVKVAGDMNLSADFRAIGETRLLGAEIGGDLVCSGGQFINGDGHALSFDSAKVAGDVFLDDGFKAAGAIRLLNAEIGGSLNCRGGQFSNMGGDALGCSRARIHGGLFWRNVKSCDGVVDFSAMHVGSFLDDKNPRGDDYILDGFTYSRFGGGAPTTAEYRVKWLKRQTSAHLNEDFRPQPWEQVVKVLREMGHDSDAREVAIEKQKALRAANKVGGFPYRQLHRLYGLLAGYGYRPINTVIALVSVWLLCTLAFLQAAHWGLIGPTSPFVTANREISEVCGNAQGRRETSWTRCSALPQEYTTFNPWLYSADLILPLVDLQQDADWAPIVMKDNGVTTLWAGAITRWLMWLEILFGWAMNLLLVAVLGNLVKKD